MGFFELWVEKRKYADFHQLQGITAFHVNDMGRTHFDRQLLKCIKRQCQSKILYILKNVEAYHQLTDSEGRTLLHFAVELGNSEFAQHLILLGADVNAINRMRQTPLMFAINAVLSLSNEVAGCEALRHETLARGINFGFIKSFGKIQTVSRFGRSANVKGDKMKLVKILIDAGATLIDTTSRRIMVADALRQGSKRLINIILESPIDLEFVDFIRMTPLHYLIYNQHWDFSDELRDKNFEVDKRYYFGHTLLHYAAEMGNGQFVRLLLDRGASINLRDNANKTPLLLAFHEQALNYLYRNGQKSPFNNIIEILLQRGVDPNILDEHDNIIVQFQITDDRILEKLMTPIFTELILLEACGQPIEPIMQNNIYSNPQLKRIFDSVNDLIGYMKETEIDDSLRLCHFMTEKDNVEMIRFARRKNVYLNVSKFAKDLYSFASSYHHRKLQRRYSAFKRFVEWRNGLLAVINEVFIKFCDLSLPNVIEKIVGRLEYEKWEEIKRCSL